MDALDVIRHETKKAYAWLENLVVEVTQETANWRPPGTANSIAQSYAHIVVNTDIDVTWLFHGEEPLIVGEWAARLGDRTYSAEEWSENPDIDWDGDYDWEVLRAYGQEVQKQIERQVEALTLDDIEREFKMTPDQLGTWTGYGVYSLHGWSHVKMHGGEIACVIGLQGGQGYRMFRPPAGP